MENLPFSTTDLVILGGIGLIGILGTYWGFVGLVTGIGAWVGAMTVTILGYPHAQAFAREQIAQELFADIAAGAGLFAGSLVILMIASSVLSHIAKESRLGSINRALGFVAGLCLGYLICCSVLLASLLVFEENSIPERVRDSRSYAIVRAGGIGIMRALPEDIGGYVLEKLEKGRQALDAVEGVRNLMQPPVERSDTGGETGYTVEDNEGLQNVIDSSDSR